MDATEWTVIETAEAEFNPTQLHHTETVFTLSNGYLGTRGSFEEGFTGASPATLINGVYDYAPIVSTELVNCPDWLPLVIFIGGESVQSPRYRFRLDQGTILSYRRWLDLYKGVLSRRVTWRSPGGHTLELQFDRFVSLADEHTLALRCQILPLDFSAPIEVHASISGYPDNNGLLHWNWLDQGYEDNTAWLKVRTRQSELELGMATRLTIAGTDASTIEAMGFQGFPTLIARYQGFAHQLVTLEKIVTVFTSRDLPLGEENSAQGNPAHRAIAHLSQQPDYTTLLAAHASAWEAVWQQSDVVIEGDLSAQLAVRYNLFQVLAATPRHDDRVSIPAKSLSGFAYRGHVFWDTEIFMLPLLIYTQPDLARNLLNYRYNTIAGARRKAKALGYEGAMYSWESAATGDEVTPTWVPSCSSNELVRIWCGDLEVHISADVAYGAVQYWKATQDDAWMQEFGVEMILDTAVFWGSRVTWNSSADRFEILDVIGPDEYHDRVDNNAFTNAIARWHLITALEILDWLKETTPERATQLQQQLDLSDKRLTYWRSIIAKLWIPYDPQTGLIEQFEGFFQREDIDLASYEPRTRSMQTILGIEGANERQVLKQADALMLLYLLREGSPVAPDGLTLGGNPYSKTLQATWDYYTPRTDHVYGSSLGPSIQAAMACRLNQPEEAYEHFMRAALVDLTNVRGNAGEGVHAASAGGIWQTVVFGFAGVQFTPDGPTATPHLPPGWTRLKFQLQWRGETVEFDLRSQSTTPPRSLHNYPMLHTLQPQFEPQNQNLSVIQGVIFDLDGVLTDTSEFHYLAWKRLADEEGLPFDRHLNESLRGVSRQDSLLKILDGRTVSTEQFQSMMDRKNGYYLELIETIAPEHLLPGALNLLQELKANHVRIALGSSSKNARDVIRRLGIDHLIEAIADGHSVTRSKPAPDVFLHAADQLGLDPKTCLVVEDAEAGVEAALRAGMRAIGLGPQERVGAAQMVLPNLDGTTWADIVETLEGRVLQPVQATIG